MKRIEEWRRIINDPGAGVLAGEHPLDDLLLHIVVHLAFADGTVDGSEQALLRRLMPEVPLSVLEDRVVQLRSELLEVGRLEARIPTSSGRAQLIALAEELVTLDGAVTHGESRLVEGLWQELR